MEDEMILSATLHLADFNGFIYHDFVCFLQIYNVQD